MIHITISLRHDNHLMEQITIAHNGMYVGGKYWQSGKKVCGFCGVENCTSCTVYKPSDFTQKIAKLIKGDST